MSVAARGVVREEMEEDEEHYLEREVEEGGDEDENYHEEEDAMQANIMNSGRSVDVWINGGTKKAEVLRELIKSFSSLIQSRPKEGAMLDYRGKYRVEDMEYMKLMDASKYVIRAKRYS